MLTSLQASLTDLRTFFANPFDRLVEGWSFADKLGRFFQVFLVDLVLVAVCLGLISLVSATGLVDLEEHAGNEMISNFNFGQLMLTAVLGIPLVEEFFFRRPLRLQANLWMWLLPLATPAADGLRDARRAELRAWWDANYRYLFYGMALVFGYMHLFNFELTTAVLLFSPILVLAQIVMGALLGYLRVRLGFWWGYALHALHNFIFVGFAFFSLQPTTVLDFSNEGFHLKVEELAEGSQANREHFNGLDSVAFTNTPLREVLQTILTAERVTFQPEDHPNPSLNVFYGARANESSSNDDILANLSEAYDFRVERSDDGAVVVFTSDGTD